MDITATLEEMMRYAVSRHRLLLANIANADTPGYKGRDLAFRAELGRADLYLVKTHPLHLGAEPGGTDIRPISRKAPPWMDGNNIDLGTEMTKMVENFLFFQAVSKMKAIRGRMFRSSLRRYA